MPAPSTDTAVTPAILLIAHGSRRAQANADLHRLKELVLERPPEGVDIVEIGFLELAEPTIPDGFKACVDRGASNVRIVPYFLSMGVHMAQDLEEFRQQFAAEYPHIGVDVRPPLGLDPKVVELVRQRCCEPLGVRCETRGVWCSDAKPAASGQGVECQRCAGSPAVA